LFNCHDKRLLYYVFASEYSIWKSESEEKTLTKRKTAACEQLLFFLLEITLF
jgi:hypothetical protein